LFFDGNELTSAVETKLFFSIVIINQLGDIGNFNRKCITWMSKLCTAEALLQLEAGLATVIVNIFDCFMTRECTGLPPNNGWKGAVDNHTNPIEVSMAWAKSIVIICQGDLAVGFSTAWMAKCYPINNNDRHLLVYIKI
jgi:hypothetical protein